MAWKRKAGIGCGVVVLLLVAAVAAVFYFRLFVPPVEVVEPGPTGRRVSESGLLGNYYPGRGAGRRPALLVLGGSEGGIGEGSKRHALALQAEGFSVLSMSYHRAPGQPPHLELIPLETFASALSWLQRQAEVDPGRIGIVGVSKGAEAALLAATRDPRIRAVVAGAPSSVAWQGSSFDRDGTFASSWSERGRPLEHLSYGPWKWWTEMGPILAATLATLPQHPGAAIPIERTSAPVLLVCGEADRLWPSCPMARQLVQRARGHGRPAITLLAYPDAGHGVLGQPRPQSRARRHRSGAGRWLAARDRVPENRAGTAGTRFPDAGKLIGSQRESGCLHEKIADAMRVCRCTPGPGNLRSIRRTRLMKLPAIVSALACLVMFIAAPLAAQTPGPAVAPVAVQQARVDDPGHPPIPVAIWSSAAGSALPLVVLSHGTGGGPIGHIDTAQALAQAGFVVVAPMHPGDNFQDDSAVGRPEWLVNRARHVSKVIDFMFAQWEGHARLVPNRVGIFGLSAGATTALISIGGVPALDRVPAHCAQHRELVCTIMVPPAAGAASGPPSWVHDRRIAAAVIAAPGLGFAFEPAGLADVRVPVQLWVGAADQTVPYETNAAVVRRLLPQPVDFHRVAGAGHLSFLAPCGPESPPQLCQDSEGFDRAAFHRELNQSMIEFFRRHLIRGAQAQQPSP